MIVVSYLVHYEFITKCGKSLLQNASDFLLQNATFLLQNARILLQNAKAITKCDVYYIMRQCKLMHHQKLITTFFKNYFSLETIKILMSLNF